MQEENTAGQEDQKPGIHQLKDKFAREMLGNKELAMAFLQEFFPEAIAGSDLSSLQQESGSFINTQYRSQYSDLLFTLKKGDEETLIYVLIEHKSQQDYWTVFYLLQLMLDIWAKWRERVRNAKTFLPPILPIILHQSHRGWTAPLRFEDYFRKEEAFTGHVPKFAAGLVDLAKVPVDQIHHTLLEMVLSLMKVVIDQGKSRQWLEKHLEDLSQVEKTMGRGKVNFILNYLAQTEDVIDISTIREMTLKLTDTKLRDNVMTWAESLKQEGRGEGELRGIKIGQIITHRELLGMGLITNSELSSMNLDQLERMAQDLKKEVSIRFKRQ